MLHEKSNTQNRRKDNPKMFTDTKILQEDRYSMQENMKWHELSTIKVQLITNLPLIKSSLRNISYLQKKCIRDRNDKYKNYHSY